MGCRSNFHHMLTIENAAEPHNVSRRTSRCDAPSIWREKVVKWCYDVVDHLNEDRSVVYVAMHILDRHSSSKDTPMNMRQYEVASLSSLFLAVHLAGSGDLSLPELVSMSRGGITTSEIVTEGNSIVRGLSHHPIVTPLDFVRSLLQSLPALPQNVELLDAAAYMIELAVCDDFFSDAKSSVLAVAALLQALPDRLLRAAVLKAAAVDPAEVAVLCTRLACIYRQSVEQLQQQHNSDEGPHWIEDDDDDNDTDRLGKRVRSSNDEDTFVVLKRAKMTL